MPPYKNYQTSVDNSLHMQDLKQLECIRNHNIFYLYKWYVSSNLLKIFQYLKNYLNLINKFTYNNIFPYV